MAKAKRPASPAMLAHLARLNADPVAKARREARLRALRADPVRRAKLARAVSLARADHTVYTLLHEASGRRASGTRKELCAMLAVSDGGLADVLNKKHRTVKGWRLTVLGEPRQYRRQLAPFSPPATSKPTAGQCREAGEFYTRPNRADPRCRERNCLLCGRVFLSAHAGNRLCGRHSTASYQPVY